MKKHALLFTFLLFFLISCKYFGDPITKLKGNIKDTQGNYLEKVSVVIQGQELGVIRNRASVQITQSDGTIDFSLIGFVEPGLWIKYEKEGFKTLKKDLILESEKVNILDVVMEKE